jgi:hypothetical protein
MTGYLTGTLADPTAPPRRPLKIVEAGLGCCSGVGPF